MRKPFLQIGAALLAFGLSLFCVQAVRVLVDVVQILQKGVPVNPDTIPKEQKESVPKQKMLKIIFKDGTGSTQIPDSLLERHERFIPLLTLGCIKGQDNIISYVTIDGDRLTQGILIRTRKELNRKISKAEKVIERIDGAKNLYGEKGLRLIIKNLDDNTRQEHYEILWYGKGTLYFIEASTLALALELENSSLYLLN